jgi:hypothetical protein
LKFKVSLRWSLKTKSWFYFERKWKLMLKTEPWLSLKGKINFGWKPKHSFKLVSLSLKQSLGISLRCKVSLG